MTWVGRKIRQQFKLGRFSLAFCAFSLLDFCRPLPSSDMGAAGTGYRFISASRLISAIHLRDASRVVFHSVLMKDRAPRYQ